MFEKLKNILNSEDNTKKSPANVKQNSGNKLKIGYIHLSGCTGDLMSFTENYDELVDLLDKYFNERKNKIKEYIKKG